MITIIYQFKYNVTWHCRINQFFSFPEQLQIWIYVFLVGDHRYDTLHKFKSYLYVNQNYKHTCMINKSYIVVLDIHTI